MSRKTRIWIRCAPVCAVVAGLSWPCWVLAAWVAVASEPGKRVEIDRDSIVAEANGETTARGRIVLDKPIVDPRTSSAYRVIEITSRFDCNERTHATLKRAYFKENGDLLRQEGVRMPYDMPVRSGTPDDRLFREACRPGGAGDGSAAGAAVKPASANQTIEKVNEAASELRQLNETLIDKEVKKDMQRLSAKASGVLSGKSVAGTVARGRKEAAAPVPSVLWGYEGAGAPEHWGKLRAEYGLCASGKRQSPIDIRDGIAVDLEPIRFEYRPATFKVIDGGRNLLVLSYGGSLSLLGKAYALTQILFHRPGETTVAGKSFDMDVQLLHRADDGKQLVVSVLLERGQENPVIQKVLNHLPLERGGEVAPPAQTIDIEQLLPGDRRYYTFMGSLTTPPCSEDVLWLVMKSPQAISPEQLSIFQRLYPANARPTQPAFGRIVKESR